MSLLADLDRENAFNGRQIGRYRLGQELGHGAFGRVYFATDTDLDREVALKFLRPVDGKYSDKLKARFKREAKLVSKLQGLHTITLYDYGELDDLVFLAFEYIDGQTIQEMLEEATHALHSLRVAKILEQSLKGIAEAHHYGILHRDIKPANIMIFEHIGVPDQVKVMDFGIGKNLYDDENLSTLTNDNAMLGTPLYMSPEHLKSDLELTPRSDLYSLGMVAYEMLTGASPYQGMSPFKIFTEIAMGPDIQLQATERIPGGLSRVINKMLKKDADERYATANEALADLIHLKPQPTAADPPNALYDSADSGDHASGAFPSAALSSSSEDAFFASEPREDTLSMDELGAATAAPDAIDAQRTRLAVAALVVTSLCAVALLGVLLSGPSDAKPHDGATDGATTGATTLQAENDTPPPEDSAPEPAPEPDPAPTPEAAADAGAVAQATPEPTPRPKSAKPDKPSKRDRELAAKRERERELAAQRERERQERLKKEREEQARLKREREAAARKQKEAEEAAAAAAAAEAAKKKNKEGNKATNLIPDL